MKRVVLAPNPTGTGHNVRMLNIGNQLLNSNLNFEITVLLGSRQDVFIDLFEKSGINVVDLSPSGVVDLSKKSHFSFVGTYHAIAALYLLGELPKYTLEAKKMV